MKKLLLVTTAIAGVAFMSAPASAAVKLDLGGFFRGYGVFADNDVTNENNFELRRDTELHATGETTLDNGLTIGFHTEMKLASDPLPADSFYRVHDANNPYTDEVYAYVSSGWGRVNFGVEDGAAYLLQVAAPSADSNIDGLRPAISGLDFSSMYAVNADTGYAHADFGGIGSSSWDRPNTDRLTYLTPKFNGFQGGFSYAPQQGIATNIGAFGTNNNVLTFDNLWEAALRYDGEFQGFGISAGAGYSDSSIQNTTGFYKDGWKTYNGGLTVSAQGFSLGGAYKKTTTEIVTNGDLDFTTWVIGGAYDNGPWHAGASYLNTKADTDTKSVDETFDKYTVGGGYAFGPGMTFRGAVAWGEFDNKSAGTSPNYTQVTVGTDIQF